MSGQIGNVGKLSIELASVDIHRDGIKRASSDAVTTVINGQRVTKAMIVVTNGKFDFAYLNLQY